MNLLSRSLLAMALAASPLAALAADSDDSVTITVNSSAGSFTSGNSAGTYNSVWKSTQTAPQLTIAVASGANNIGSFNSDGYMVYYTGQSSPSVLNLTASDGWYVAGYEFDAALATDGTISVTANDGTAVDMTSDTQHFSATLEEGTVAAITFTGDNKGVTLSNFTVTMKVGAAPSFYATTITDGKFDEETPWYTMKIGASGIYIKSSEANGTITLDSVDTTLDDSELWCFVGDNVNGYRIYNKAIGAGYALAAPSNVGTNDSNGGTSYAKVVAEGQEGYTYEWMTKYSTSISGVSGVFLTAKDHSTWTLNNRDNILAFWTSGADAGSTFQVELGEFTAIISPTTGSTDTSKTWVSTWTRDKEPLVTFGTGYNNMEIVNGNIGIATGSSNAAWTFTVPTDMRVSGYEFDYKRNSDTWGATNSLTLGNSAPISISAETEAGHAEMKDLTVNDDYTFTYTGTNGLVLELSNFKVKVVRTLDERLGTIVFRYDGTTNYNVVYRIPAITTINAGTNKDRVLAINDYRYCGADIGNGRIDLHQSYSDDQGATWSEPKVMVDANGTAVSQGDGQGTVETSLDNADCGFGDPAIVSDSETGKVLVMSVCGRTPFFSATRSNPNQVARWYSEDGGDTWTPFQNITDQIYKLFDETSPYGYIDAMFFGSGKICQSRQVKVGNYYRLYAVISGRNIAASNLSNWVLYSDDFGENWAVLGDPMQPAVASGADEPKAEELPDGSVLLAARGNGGNRNFNIFRYTDIKNATGSWGSAVNTNCGAGFTINATDGEILILPAKSTTTDEQCYIALQSLPYSTSRTKVSILWKVISSGSDILTPSCFSTWNGRYQITNLSSAYSTMTLQTDNTIGFLYEEATYGKAYCEVYRNLTLDEITGQQYTYNVDTNNAKADAIRDELVTLRAADFDGIESKYVGQPTEEGIKAINSAVEAYKANSNSDTYLAFNAATALSDDDAYITIQKNGLYRIISAHDGQYTVTSDYYLTSDGTNLKSSTTDEESNYFALMQRSNSTNWVLYHPATASFVPASPATYATFTVSTNVDDAVEYQIVSAYTGKSYISCTAPTSSYSCIHLNSGFNIVPWGNAAKASQWYLEFIRTADALPAIEEESIVFDNIEPAEQPAQRSYFDLLGRPVAAPKPGQLYITSDRKKVVF